MTLFVGLSPDVFSTRSAKTSLIAKMVAQGVPDEVGMLISGHHLTGGYRGGCLRYDRTKRFKMEVATSRPQLNLIPYTLVSSSPGLDYEKAHVSQNFLQEELVGSFSGMKLLISRVSDI